MMKKILLSTILATVYSSQVLAAADYTIYLTRHAEKESGKNPALTQCGSLRAQQLATMLQDTNIKQIYSTSYNRTMATAQPLSNSTKLPVKQYTPNRLSQLAHQLKKDKTTTLVVGHSNTTPELVKQLIGQQVTAIDESEYQMLYQIQFIESQPHLTILRQPLTCR